MSNDLHDKDGMLDEDPALDYVLYREMEKENKKPTGKGGCLTILLILILPAFYAVIHFTVICPITSG